MSELTAVYSSLQTVLSGLYEAQDRNWISLRTQTPTAIEGDCHVIWLWMNTNSDEVDIMPSERSPELLVIDNQTKRPVELFEGSSLPDSAMRISKRRFCTKVQRAIGAIADAEKRGLSFAVLKLIDGDDVRTIIPFRSRPDDGYGELELNVRDGTYKHVFRSCLP